MPKPAERNRPWSPDDDRFLWQHQSHGLAWLATVLRRNKSQIGDRLFSLATDPAARAALERLPISKAGRLPCDPLEMNGWYAGLKAQRAAKLSLRTVRVRV